MKVRQVRFHTGATRARSQPFTPSDQSADESERTLPRALHFLANHLLLIVYYLLFKKVTCSIFFPVDLKVLFL